MHSAFFTARRRLPRDNENLTQPVATFKPRQRVVDLDDKLSLFQNVCSVRIARAK